MTLKPTTLLALAALMALACGAPDDSALYRATTRTYPDGGITEELEPIGQASQAISALGFYGWRAESVSMRGRLCADVVAAEGDQVCVVPAVKPQRYFVDAAGFSAADALQVSQGLQNTRSQWSLIGVDTDLGWTMSNTGTPSDYTIRVRAGAVNGAGYDADDVRRWASLSCDGLSGTLTEPTPLVGTWRRCGAITVTIDVVNMQADGCAQCRNPRLRQGGALGLVWGVGLGIGNINVGTVFQRTSAGTSNLSAGMTSRDYCALERFSLGAKTEIRKVPLSECD